MRVLPWIAFLLVVCVAWLAGHFVDPQSVNWRALEIASLALGSIGLITVIGESQRLIPTNRLEFVKSRTLSILETLSFVAPRYEGIIESRMDHLRENSGSYDPDPYERALPWFASVSRLSTEFGKNEPPEVDCSLIQFPGDIVDKEIMSLKEHIDEMLGWYRERKQEYDSTKNDASRGGLEEAAVFFAPYFLILAIGLAFFRAMYAP